MFDFLIPVLRNLFKKPATRLYPISLRDPFNNARGHIKGINDNCVFCGICSKKCPSDAITVDRNAKTWKIDRFKCVICNVCVESCPKKCITMESAYKTAEYKKTYEIIVGKQNKQINSKPLGVEDSCVYCGICAKSCPQNSIIVDRTNKSWSIDSNNCVGCGICISKCPKKSIKTQ